MKKIYFSLIFVVSILLVGCSSNETNNRSLPEYLLLEENIPTGFQLFPFGGSSDLEELTGNPGRLLENIEMEVFKTNNLGEYYIVVYVPIEKISMSNAVVVYMFESPLEEILESDPLQQLLAESTIIYETPERYTIILSSFTDAVGPFTSKYEELFTLTDITNLLIERNLDEVEPIRPVASLVAQDLISSGIYILNQRDENVFLNEILINGNTCTSNQIILLPGINFIECTNLTFETLELGELKDVLLITDSLGVFSFYLEVKEESSFDNERGLSSQHNNLQLITLERLEETRIFLSNRGQSNLIINVSVRGLDQPLTCGPSQQQVLFPGVHSIDLSLGCPTEGMAEVIVEVDSEGVFTFRGTVRRSSN